MSVFGWHNRQSGPEAKRLASLALSNSRILSNVERATVAGSALAQAEVELKSAFSGLLQPSRETSRRIAHLASLELNNAGTLSWLEFREVAGSVVSQSPYKSALG